MKNVNLKDFVAKDAVMLDGDYIVVGRSMRFPSSPAVARYDARGKLIWMSCVEVDAVVSLTKVLKTKNDRLFAAGYVKSSLEFDGKADLLMLVYDFDGGLCWRSVLSDFSSARNLMLTDIVEYDDAIVCVGNSLDDANGSNAFAVKVNYDGLKLSSYCMDGVFTTYNSILLHDRDFYAVGGGGDDIRDMSGVIVRHDDSLYYEERPITIHRNAYSFELFDAVVTSKGDAFITCGRKLSAKDEDSFARGYIVKIPFEAGPSIAWRITADDLTGFKGFEKIIPLGGNNYALIGKFNVDGYAGGRTKISIVRDLGEHNIFRTSKIDLGFLDCNSAFVDRNELVMVCEANADGAHDSVIKRFSADEL